MAIKKDTFDKIVGQSLQEIQFARTYKQGKISNWQKNERLYYGMKEKAEDSRTNIDLGRGQEFVNTVLSKIDNALSFKFTKRKDSQLKRVLRLNSLRKRDQEVNDWDIKDIAGKKQATIYGRAIYSYHADSMDGDYCPHLENIDVYDFLIDPSAGGLFIDNAKYLGNYGVVKMRHELEAGVKSKIYIKSEVQTLLDGSGNSTESSQEQTNKADRTRDTFVTRTQKEITSPDKFKFWQWYTTFEGKRYYLLITESSGTCIRMELLSDIFPVEKKLKDAMYPIWSWAALVDMTEFWTPSLMDAVREIFMAQTVAINQTFDNVEQINKPTRYVDVEALEDLASLKYRRGGSIVKVKKGFDVSKVIQTQQTPSINTGLAIYEKLDAIQEKASGITAGAKGVSGDDKVGIYEGNQANTADRFGLLNKAYAFGYKRFAVLWEQGVREHLTKEIAVDILGPDGVEIEEVSRRDIFRKNESFGLTVEASDAETAIADTDKRTKIAFLTANAQNPIQNQQKAYEMNASIAGFNEEEVRQLLDVSEFGDASLMSEAERDIERILDGEKIEPNEAATTAYKQRFVDYMRDNKEDIDMEQFTSLADYVMKLDPIIMRNTVRTLNQNILKTGTNPVDAGKGVPTDAMAGQIDSALPVEGNQVTGQQ